jgi:hypothetical protein
VQASPAKQRNARRNSLAGERGWRLTASYATLMKITEAPARPPQGH